MAKPARKYVCQSCGAESAQWAGRCDGCGAWNTLQEETGAGAGIGGAPNKAAVRGRGIELVSLKGEDVAPDRIVSGLGEFDRVTGGGMVPGSVTIVGGDPGIGKSTLLLQLLAAIGSAGHSAIYLSGEEAIAQVRLRAQRLGLADAPLTVGVETNLSNILATLDKQAPPRVLVVDSIQTLWSPALESAPGTISQLRAGAQALIGFAKTKGTAVILVGHVTKDGQLAGPKVIEHMVDTVLHFEGEAGHQFRLLRSMKNRFGPTDEIGVFEMSDGGLREVANPSELFIGARDNIAPGAAIFAGIEGTRPILVEIQALVAASPLATPRRAVVGWDTNRLAMVLAVLDAHAGLHFSGHDIYLNVAGGLRVREPAADLAVAAALVSSLTNAALPADSTFFGEVSLSGALRPVGHTAARLKEASKLGFKSIAVAAGSLKSIKSPGDDLDIAELRTVDDLSAWVREHGTPGSMRRSSVEAADSEVIE
jgi:DNA repair protein RadA/Sms